MNQGLSSRGSLEEKVKKNINAALFVLLLLAVQFLFSSLPLQPQHLKEHLKKIRPEILLKSHVSRHWGLKSRAADIILRFGSALCIILSDGLQHSLITAG